VGASTIPICSVGDNQARAILNHEPIYIDGRLCFYESNSDNEYQYMPTETIVDNDFKDDEDYGIYMFY
jgi:hypothetical protein